MPAAGTVLVLTELFDPTADLVIEELNSRKIPVFRFDTADFPHRLSLEAELRGGRWTGVLQNDHRRTTLEGISAVWYRRPSRFHFPDLPEPERRFAAAQARAGFGGVLAALPCRWVNHPHAIGRAEYKAAQLPAAALCGLTVPATLITSVPDAQRRFAESASEPIIYKPLSSGSVADGDTLHFVYTHQVPRDEWNDPQIASTAHLFQTWVPKDYEVRLIVVGDQLFPAAIHATSDTARVDWRADYANHRYSTVKIPERVRLGVSMLMAHFGLLFAALDFAVHQGEWNFLELNPNGQWAWLEQELGLPITAALANLLAQGRSDD